MPSVESWRALAERIYAKGVDVFNGCSVTPSEDGPRDSKVVARTHKNTAEAAHFLIRSQEEQLAAQKSKKMA